MLEKLEPINGVSIYGTARVALVEKTIQLLTRLSIRMLSLFYKGNSTKLSEVAGNTQHLQYEIIQDDVLQRLITLPNVMITGHQAYFL